LSESIHTAFRHLRAAVLEGQGTVSPAERQRIAAWSANPDQEPASQHFPEPLARLLTKITRYAYTVTDEDIEALLKAGYAEDAIFESVVSAALGTAIRRYERGMAVLKEAQGGDDETQDS
jgi:hypothetical protein